MTFINILIVVIWKSRQAFRAYGWGNMPLQAVKLPISHNNVVGENTVLQLNILETGVLTLLVQNSSPTRLRLVGDELWTTRVRTPVSKMFRWRTYNSWAGKDVSCNLPDHARTFHIKRSDESIKVRNARYIQPFESHTAWPSWAMTFNDYSCQVQVPEHVKQEILELVWIIPFSEYIPYLFIHLLSPVWWAIVHLKAFRTDPS